MRSREIICPQCKGRDLAKAGRRKIKSRTVQIYRCRQCHNFFSDREMKHKTYHSRIILNAISAYDLGYTLDETSRQMARRFKIKIPVSTIHSWIKQYRHLCRYADLREAGRRRYQPTEILFAKEFEHQQCYKFQYHKAKLDLRLEQKGQQRLQPVKEYLEWVAGQRPNCPGTSRSRPFPHHIFTEKNTESKQRASQVRMQRYIPLKVTRDNLAQELAEYGLKLARTNYQRHEEVQNFMLINDATTVAAEVPVYLTGDDIQYFKEKGFCFGFGSKHTPITGHIDLVQIRNNLIYILDYKPGARLEKPFEQLVTYALALSSRTKLAVKDFKCAWFDDQNYFEFFPLHAVYLSEKRKLKK